MCLGTAGAPCSTLTTNKGGRCDECRRIQARVTRDPILDSRAWRDLSDATVAAWRQQNGNLCPGWGEPPHQATRENPLTADHRVPRAKGGAALDPRNVVVLCLRCNGRKAAHDAKEVPAR